MNSTSNSPPAGSGQHQHRKRRHAAAAANEPEDNPPMELPFGDSLGGRGGGGGGRRSRLPTASARRRASQDGFGGAVPARRRSIESRHSAPARYHDHDEEEEEERPRRFRDIEDIMDLREGSSAVVLRTGGASDSVSDGSLSSNGASVRSTSSMSGGLSGPAFRGFFPTKGSGSASDGSVSDEGVRSTPLSPGGVAGLNLGRFFPGKGFRFGSPRETQSVSSTDLSSMMAEGESTTIDTGDRSGSLRHSLSSRDSILSYGNSGGLLSLSESSGDSSSSSSSIRSFDLSAMMGDKSTRIGKGAARRCARIGLAVAAALALAMLATQLRNGISKSMLDGVGPVTSNFKTKTDGSNSFRKLFDSQHRGSSDNESFSQVQDTAQDYQQVQDAAPVYQLQYQALPDGGGRLVLGNMSGAVARDEAAPAGRAIPAYKEFKPNDKVNLDSEIVALMERSVYDHNDKWKK